MINQDFNALGSFDHDPEIGGDHEPTATNTPTPELAQHLIEWSSGVNRPEFRAHLLEAAAAIAKLTVERGAAVADHDEAYEIGKRDGYEEAIQDIDRLTGGDGEYRYCTDHDPDRHTPDADTMKQRIVERFETLNTMESVSEINEWRRRATAAEESAERNGKWLDELARAVVEYFRIEEPSDGFNDIHTTAHEILNGDFTTDSDADRSNKLLSERVAVLETALDTERFDDLSPEESIGAFDGSGQWIELCTVGDLRRALAAREAK